VKVDIRYSVKSGCAVDLGVDGFGEIQVFGEMRLRPREIFFSLINLSSISIDIQFFFFLNFLNQPLNLYDYR
jgi:hypothetical protein